jgi:hypothetical protein
LSVAADLPVGLSPTFTAALLDEHVLFVATDEATEQDSLWLGPAHPGGEAPAMIATSPAPELRIEAMSVAPDQTFAVYLTGEIGPSSEAAYLVDLDPTPLPEPVEIGLLPGVEYVEHLKFSPDGRGFTLAQGVLGSFAELAWVAVEDGVPAAPVSISGNSGFTVLRSWSPDGNWLAWVGGDPLRIFVASFDGEVWGVPQEPAGAGAATSNITAFAPDGSYVYFVAHGDRSVTLQRAALSGQSVGSPESLSGPIKESFSYLALADDGSGLVFVAAINLGEPQHAWWVDLSGDVPAPPVQLDDVSAKGSGVFSVSIAPGASHVLYTTYEESAARRAGIVDMATLSVLSLANDEPVGFAFLRALP